MVGVGDGVDVLLVVPFEPIAAHVMDPTIRQTLGAHSGAPLSQAVAEFEEYLGHSLGVLQWTGHPMWQGEATTYRAQRSLTAVTLATHLEKHRIEWAALDPGVQDLRYWRRVLGRLRARPPRIVALSTTFVIGPPWLEALVGLVRRMLPESTLLLGGGFYFNNVRQFLALDGDVLCLGEGERRLPQIVEAILGGRPLAEIPGIYYRQTDGTLKYTGPVEPLDLDLLEPVDWGLAQRIEPPMDEEAEPGFYSVETQRGCAFRCEFCTFRNLTFYQKMCPEKAAAAILATGVMPPGFIFLVDSTGTFPHARWEEILRRLIDRGGAPHRLIAFARVTDLKEPIAALMARAGVGGVVVGQESGDPRILREMNKAVKVEHVKPAVAALAKAGLGGLFSFIHGFPGETSESIRATRAMITGLNDGFESQLVVPTYDLAPFSVFDLALVSQREGMRGARHFMGYDAAAFPPQRVAEELLATLIAASRVPHAPLCSFLFNAQMNLLFNVADRQRRQSIHRWLKAFERGVAIFLERDMDGAAPDLEELRRLREEVLAHCPPKSRLGRAISRVKSRAEIRASRRMRAEWLREKQRGPGLMTRSFAAFSTYRDFGRIVDAARAWRAGGYPELEHHFPPNPAATETLATDLIHQALG